MVVLAQKIDMTTAQVNMISQQIRTNGVDSEDILALFSQIPRAAFVPMEYQALAYSDTELPIGHHQTMLSPMIEAQILQCLHLSKNDLVLEVGTGSGYLTALLARLSHTVYSVDKYSEFTRNAAKKLAQFKINNAHLETGHAAQGWPLHAPYHAIVIGGSLPTLNQHFLQQLTIGGRMFVVIGTGVCQTAMLITRVGNKQWQQKKLFETVLPPLEDVALINEFVF